MINSAAMGWKESMGGDAQLNSDTPTLEQPSKIMLPSASPGGINSSWSYLRLERLSLLGCCAWAFIRLLSCASCSLPEPAGILGAVRRREFSSMLNAEDKDMHKCLSAQGPGFTFSFLILLPFVS